MAEQQGGGGLTTLGKAVVGLFVIGLLGAGVVGIAVVGGFVGAPAPGDGPQLDLDEANKQLGNNTDKTGVKLEVIQDFAHVTTVQEYEFVPAERLPAVEGTSDYTWDDENKVVQFPINVWIGWLPIVAANNGFAPNEESIFYKKYGFKVELKLIDDPVAARNAYATGESHVLWGTLDMMVLFAPGLMKDSRTAPRIFQQVDWSAGGDGIVVRDGINSVADLKGKTVVYAQNSPSQYYLNALLISAGVQPASVKSKFTVDAFQASAAFVSDPSIDAVVSWAPDIYNIPEKVPGTKILSTTADANKLIADVWAVRADFAKDHPDIVKGLVAGIFHGMEEVQKNPGPAIGWMADGYGMSADEVKDMMADAHSTNFAENKEFFLNKRNPTNFEHTWNAISYVYKELGLIDRPTRFDQVMDFSAIQAIEKEGTFKDQKNEYKTNFAPVSYTKITAEAPILTQELRINFYPNSHNLKELGRDEFGNAVEGTLYDPLVDKTVQRAGVLAGQFEAARIVVTGHTDASMKGKVPYEAVKELSERRANAVKDELVEKYQFDAAKFVVKGLGWDKPADPEDPNNHFKNRRVEVAVYPPEAE